MVELYTLLYRTNKKRQVLFHANESVVDQLDKVGHAFKIGRSELIRVAILQFLEKELPIANKILQEKHNIL